MRVLFTLPMASKTARSRMRTGGGGGNKAEVSVALPWGNILL